MPLNYYRYALFFFQKKIVLHSLLSSAQTKEIKNEKFPRKIISLPTQLLLVWNDICSNSKNNSKFRFQPDMLLQSIFLTQFDQATV